MRWACFHLHLVLPRWHTSRLEQVPLLSYGDKVVVSNVLRPEAADRTTRVHANGLNAMVDIPLDVHRESKRTYGKVWGMARTAASLLCVDYGMVYKEEVEELLVCLKRVTDSVRQREALKAIIPEDRALVEALQTVANVQDGYRPDNKQRGLRKCSVCKSTAHTKATCPHKSFSSGAENQAPAHADGAEKAA